MQIDAGWLTLAGLAVSVVSVVVAVIYSRRQVAVASAQVAQANRAERRALNRLLRLEIRAAVDALEALHETRAKFRHMRDTRDPDETDLLINHPLWSQSIAAQAAYADAVKTLGIDAMSEQCPPFVAISSWKWNTSSAIVGFVKLRARKATMNWFTDLDVRSAKWISP